MILTLALPPPGRGREAGRFFKRRPGGRVRQEGGGFHKAPPDPEENTAPPAPRPQPAHPLLRGGGARDEVPFVPARGNPTNGPSERKEQVRLEPAGP